MSYCHFLQNRSDVAAKNSVDEIVNIIRLLCRMITIVLLTQRSRLSGPFKYLARFHKGYRKFSRSIWKKVSAQNRRFSQNIPSWLWAPFLAHNWAETFFKYPQKLFCGLHVHIQGIWKVFWAHIFASVKKSWPYDTPSRLYVRKSGKIEVLKKWSSKSAWNILTNLPVLSWKFFSNTSRKFPVNFMKSCKVSERST